VKSENQMANGESGVRRTFAAALKTSSYLLHFVFVLILIFP
jgi:hypothetical protein